MVSTDCLYIKSDGSLDDGMELVSHPMSLDYHKSYYWKEIMRTAIRQGYRSHNTSTCGMHVHVNRSCMGETREEQDEVIGRILFFVEKNWNELLKFSRRSEYSMNRWAARYGYEKTGREILDKAKKGNNGRYAAVNLMNYATIEFRLFQFDAPADGKQNGLHAGQLKSYIQLCLALSELAKIQRNASSRPQQHENPKYAMRTWLLRLGFIGDEFKTAREVLTKRLSGDGAFRNGRETA